ncbi:MAG: hypothetical protein L6R38_001608 [Xanthoria sp. 2 TBL-2021]|nr:MAG: hypothetical protein L6R38_001608 [Xanthoria sp. 2 TBL-2021]
MPLFTPLSHSPTPQLLIAHPNYGEVSLELRCVIVACRLLNSSTYTENKKKTGVLANSAQVIISRATERARNQDLYDILACVGDTNRSGRPQRITEGSQTSKDIRQAILKYNKEKPQQAVKMEKENIDIPTKPSQKPLSRPMIERIQYKHIHKLPDGMFIEEIVRGAIPTKPRLNKVHIAERLAWCRWAIKEIEEKGAIFIYSDEAYHQVNGGRSRKRRRMSRPKGSTPER